MSSARFLTITFTLLLSSAALADLHQAFLCKTYEAPIVINGESVGSIKLPVGAQVEIISEQDLEYTVRRGGQIPFKIPKDFIAGSTNAVAPSKSGMLGGMNSATVFLALQTLREQVMGFFNHAEKTAVENYHYLRGLLGIGSAPPPTVATPALAPQTSPAGLVAPVAVIQSLVSKVVSAGSSPADKETQSAATTPVPAPNIVDHFSSQLSSAKNGISRAMSMSYAFGLADLEQAKAKAIREKKPLGFIMVWETKGDFFNYRTDTRNKYGASALLHFYDVFNNDLVLVFVRHENELGLVPPAVNQGFSGPDEGGWAPNMAVTDATAQELIVEIPTSNQDGAGRDKIFADGAKKIDLWLSTHLDAVTKLQ